MNLQRGQGLAGDTHVCFTQNHLGWLAWGLEDPFPGLMSVAASWCRLLSESSAGVEDPEPWFLSTWASPCDWGFLTAWWLQGHMVVWERERERTESASGRGAISFYELGLTAAQNFTSPQRWSQSSAQVHKGRDLDSTFDGGVASHIVREPHGTGDLVKSSLAKTVGSKYSHMQTNVSFLLGTCVLYYM